MTAAVDGESMSMRALLEAGMHFGHQTKRWNPKMKPYIYGTRNGIHIIDLQQTQPLFQAAFKKVIEVVSNGHSVLFVGTKRQAQEVMREEATRCGMYFVTNRWLGGTLTNFRTVRGSIDKLRTIETMIQTEGEKLIKKERLRLDRSAIKLDRNLGGIKDMASLPGLLVVVDPKKERIAVAEARRLEIPIVALTDTNCDPDTVDYVVPANDDAIRSIRLFAARLADACLLGQRFGRVRAVAVNRERDQQREQAASEPIRVASGGDGPKVEVVSRRSGPRPEPEAAATPDENPK
ncbi:MAG: 30S ribosomal protein S2 [Proteobacteria bacterium]|nr:30S ribosomal protein S2 [Pseudomonadota bacterium]